MLGGQLQEGATGGLLMWRDVDFDGEDLGAAAPAVRWFIARAHR